MAHELENNKSMFSVQATPWHGLGEVLDNPPTIEEGLQLAGLDWEVILQPLFTEAGTRVTHQAVERQSDKSILGIVGPSYTPLQNKDAFNFFQPFLDQKLATLETAGSLKGGTRVWILAKITGGPISIKGDDVIDKYILLSNSFDGLIAVRVGFTPVRVVCNNTLSMAHHDKASKLIRVKHSTKVVENVEKIAEIMDAANAEFTATAEQYRYLASQQINEKDLEKYVKLVFKIEDKRKKIVTLQEDHEEKLRINRTLEGVKRVYAEGRGMSDTPDTYWKAYNAVNEFLAYHRGRTAGSRMESMWFGDSARVDKKALASALKMAGEVSHA